jgi:hypothetical protein
VWEQGSFYLTSGVSASTASMALLALSPARAAAASAPLHTSRQDDYDHDHHDMSLRSSSGSSGVAGGYSGRIGGQGVTGVAPSALLYWSPSATAAAKHTAAAIKQRLPAAAPSATAVPWCWFPSAVPVPAGVAGRGPGGPGADLQPFVYLSRRRPLPPAPSSTTRDRGYWGGGGECLALNEHGVAVYVGYVLQPDAGGPGPGSVRPWPCRVLCAAARPHVVTVGKLDAFLSLSRPLSILI